MHFRTSHIRTFALRAGAQMQICESAKVLEHIRTFAQAHSHFWALRGHASPSPDGRIRVDWKADRHSLYVLEDTYLNKYLTS